MESPGVTKARQGAAGDPAAAKPTKVRLRREPSVPDGLVAEPIIKVDTHTKGNQKQIAESPWVWWRLGLLDSNQGLVGLLGSVERCFELGGW